ncbi:MAG: response regulator transcription factor [Bacteroidales bacterium]|nr:response regulator transcription factor [Bacteroidales bacterium]MCF8343198.1 response regulator transcription factor [Bacteroidales bacterium]MCF8352127.1 response regulator transcription factor [Bacteroidales bacterium]MCF8377281.1 response regulator transcription factor [Bacteroidales bacterium]MCF8401097.1 response regulator transcription factor [Bacteroidales bacterium]
MIKVFIADDHPVVIDGISAYFQNSDNIKFVGSAKDGIECMEFLKKTPVDVLLLDYRMPGKNGLDICKEIKENQSETKVLVFTTYDNLPLIKDFDNHGADGYILKDASAAEIIEAIKAVYLGGRYYSGKIRDILIQSRDNQNECFLFKKIEKDVLRLLVKGMNNTQIAKELCIAQDTVKSRRRDMLARFKQYCGDNNNMNSLLYYAVKNNLIE